jgi:hypothetical protein
MGADFPRGERLAMEIRNSQPPAWKTGKSIKTKDF